MVQLCHNYGTKVKSLWSVTNKKSTINPLTKLQRLLFNINATTNQKLSNPWKNKF